MQGVPDGLLGGLVTTENRTSGLENMTIGTEKQRKDAISHRAQTYHTSLLETPGKRELNISKAQR